MPIIVEVVDTKENIDRFLSKVEEITKDILITTEDINIKIYKPPKK